MVLRHPSDAQAQALEARPSVRSQAMNKITWQPGEHGKGIVDEYGNVHAWNEDEYQLHHDYLDANPNMHAGAYFYIEPNGAIDLTQPHPAYDDPREVEIMSDRIMEADPHFHMAEPDRFSFG